MKPFEILVFHTGVTFNKVTGKPVCINYNGGDPLTLPFSLDVINELTDEALTGEGTGRDMYTREITGMKDRLISSGFTGKVLVKSWCGEGPCEYGYAIPDDLDEVKDWVIGDGDQNCQFDYDPGDSRIEKDYQTLKRENVLGDIANEEVETFITNVADLLACFEESLNALAA